ncbi:MAG: hypothetical protein RI947_548 [Candidatus Parcubacteria bacterium]|jgi:MFS family permease
MYTIKKKAAEYFPALKTYNYRIYFFGQGVSLIGTWFASVAQQWLIYPTLTTDKSFLGIVSAVNMIPVALLVLIAGVYADRINKRKTVIAIQLIFAVIALLISGLVFTGTIQIWHVLVASALSGIVFAFDMPTRNALVIDLVDKRDLPSALSLNSGIFNAARALGPALAGIMIAMIGIGPAYLIDGLSFFAVIASLYYMKVPPHMPTANKRSFAEEFKEGISYLMDQRIITVILLLVGVVSFCTWPASVLLPVYAHDIFKSGEIGYGILQSSIGLGAMVGAFGFSKLFEKITDIYSFIMRMFIVCFVLYATFAFTTIYPIAIALLVSMGWVVSTLYGALNTLLQMNAPTHMRGRIMSFYSFMIFTSLPLGAIYTSIGVQLMGVRMTIVSAAVTMIVVIGALHFIGRHIIAHKMAYLHNTIQGR